MRVIKGMVIMTIPSLLAACGTTPAVAPASAPRLAVIDSAFTRPCPPLTVGAIPKGDQELLLVLDPIREDLENYRVCRYRHGKLVEAIRAVYAAQGAGLQ